MVIPSQLLRRAAVLLDVVVIVVNCSAFDFARGCESYADLFRVFLPVSGIVVFAEAGV